jgi:hypothetical protein
VSDQRPIRSDNIDIRQGACSGLHSASRQSHVDGEDEQPSNDEIPVLPGYPDGQTLPTPEAIDFSPGELLGSVSGGEDEARP